MRIAFFYHAYRDNLRYMQAMHPGLGALPLREQQAIVHRYNYLFKGYELQFGALGHEVFTLPVNAEFLLKQWAQAYNQPTADSETLVVQWAKQVKPDVVFYHPHYVGLLQKLREALPGVRLWVVPANNPIHDARILKYTDVVFSCIPDMVRMLTGQGVRAFYMPHGYPDHLLYDQPATPDRNSLAFIGSIVREAGFHQKREDLLLSLGKKLSVDGLAIYSPSYNYKIADSVKTLGKQVAYAVTYPLRKLPELRKPLEQVKPIAEALNLPAWPRAPLNSALRPYLKPSVFGPDMFNTLRAHTAVLNTHIDVSATSASNMRLYEATGAGACLLTDWKENLHEMFTPDLEVATYRTTEEAVEKARYLLQNPKAAAALGQASAVRVRGEHLQSHRVVRMLEQMRKLGVS